MAARLSNSVERSERLAARIGAEMLFALIGMAFVASALAANRSWVDRHFLPPFLVSHHLYVLVGSVERGVLAVLGVTLGIFARPRIGQFVARVTVGRLVTDAAGILLAIILALGTSEFVLRLTFRHSSEEQPATQIPYRRLDDRLGWVFVPSRTERETADGRTVEYAFDSSGYRVRRVNESPDPERPTIVFSGESIMAGQGLNWEDTVPAQGESLLGGESANTPVHGFGTDQAYMRLRAELPRFRRPVAVVTLFTPGLFDRNLDDDRPHMGPGLVWLPGKPRWRLAMIASWVVPYRSTKAIERGIVLTRAVLRATVDLARSRGATPLILVPQFLPEDPTERALQRRILDESGLPYVWVGLDPRWRRASEQHPDARGEIGRAA